MFAKFIEDRCFDHKVVDLIACYDPRSWRGVMIAKGPIHFFGEFLRAETLELTTTFWPQIDSVGAWSGLKTVKKFWHYLYGKDNQTQIPRLQVFGQAVLSGHPQSSMDAVCQLYGSFMAVLPTAMGVEGQNSVSTLAFSDHRKSTICQSLHETVNVKVNAPGLAKFDCRRIANLLTDKAHDYPINVAKHIAQPEMQPFFQKAEEQNPEIIEDKIASILIGTRPTRNIAQSAMNKHISDRDRAHSASTEKLQRNITEYFSIKKSPPNSLSPLPIANIPDPEQQMVCHRMPFRSM